jgi:hypothetical protein
VRWINWWPLCRDLFFIAPFPKEKELRKGGSTAQLFGYGPPIAHFTSLTLERRILLVKMKIFSGAAKNEPFIS